MIHLITKYMHINPSFILIFYLLNLFHWFLRLENTRGEVTQCVLQQGQVAATRREDKSLWQVPLSVLTLKNAFLAAKNCHKSGALGDIHTSLKEGFRFESPNPNRNSSSYITLSFKSPPPLEFAVTLPGHFLAPILKTKMLSWNHVLQTHPTLKFESITKLNLLYLITSYFNF